MPPVDDRTLYRSYQKPNAANTLADDVARLRAALDAIDDDIAPYVKKDVICATTANITLSGTQTIDGIAVVAGNRVLVKNQTAAQDNGIYVASATAWVRASDINTALAAANAIVGVERGTTNGGDIFTTPFKATDTLGTTAMNWYQFVDTSFASSTTPGNIGTAAIGTSANYARADHVHDLPNTTVTAASYTFTSLTVDAKGRLTAASSGTPVTSFSAGTTGLTPSTATTGAVTLAGTLAVANGGTGVTTSTGSGSNVLSTSPSLTTPVLGTPASGTLTNCTGYTFANIASKPTTLSGYGITDAATSTGTGASGTWAINTNGFLSDASYRSIVNPGGGQFTTTTSTLTGAIAVTLPVGMTNTMVRMTIKVYEYTTNESFEIICGGYNYNVSSTWANNPFAYIVGNPDIDRRFNVRFGYTAGGRAIVYIGELASTWSYPQVFITEVQCGYSGTSATWATGWSIAFQSTAFENVTATISNCQIGFRSSTNTANSVALRDASGNFSAGTITASLTGNATTATTLQTTRTIWGQNFNGSANVTGALSSVSTITFTAEASDAASIGPTISSNQTAFDFNLADDNNNDLWRWRFTPSGSTVYNAMTLTPTANGVSNLAVAGTIQGTQLQSTVATGTAPLTVSSTTLVTNLNANLLNGVSWGNVNTNIATTGSIVINNGSPTIYLQDTDHNSSAVHCNSNIFYVLRGGNNTTSMTTVDGVWPLEINLTNNDATFGRSIYSQSYQNVVKFSAPWRNDGVTALASSYNFIMTGGNDTGNKLVMFLNSSTRTADGGVNALTLRNDGGPLNLGNASFATNLFGSSFTYGGNTVWHAGNDGTGSGLDADLLDGVDSLTRTASHRANRNISGGGTITVDASANVLWTSRFIVISNGRGAYFGTSGYFDITCPTSGTITGVGGAGNVTATAAGIPLAAWHAIYYILPIGSTNGSVAANFRIVSYTADLNIPHDWVLICVRNGDNGAVTFNNGITLSPGQSLSSVQQANTNTANTLVRRDGSGNFSAGTITAALAGNAASATTAVNLSTTSSNWSSNGTISAVVGQLGWKNYGNGHTIFDASNSTSPSGTAVNNTNAQIAWTGTYPTLMGWNGANTYGVRVDSARVADNASSLSVRVSSTGVSGGTLTPNVDTTDLYIAESLSTTTTMGIPTGSPANGQKLMIRLNSVNVTSQSLIWTTSSGGYRPVGTTLPTAINNGKWIYVGCVYNTSASYWDVIAVTILI